MSADLSKLSAPELFAEIRDESGELGDSEVFMAALIELARRQHREADMCDCSWRGVGRGFVLIQMGRLCRKHSRACEEAARGERD